ncbi:hypothetical protein [Pimelobacter sp. 30-1]|uniref:hypothetical protein n=1 Tax=Pimelobacter sp. 30-1 TaxID=2004991 RepID=UPI001C053AFC|nr:hypothetical protein [Pimelobacter sp. 30-1]MBU2698796.1 hypothetical protein [Pimelobacter sp. 30-1]
MNNDNPLAQLEQLGGFALAGALLAALMFAGLLCFRHGMTGAFTRRGADKKAMELYRRELACYSSAIHRLVDAGGGEMVMHLRRGNAPQLLAADLKAAGTTAAIAQRGYSLHLLPARGGVMVRATPIAPPRPVRSRGRSGSLFTLVIGRTDRSATSAPAAVDVRPAPAQAAPAEQSVEASSEPAIDPEGWQVYVPGGRSSEDGRPITDQHADQLLVDERDAQPGSRWREPARRLRAAARELSGQDRR